MYLLPRFKVAPIALALLLTGCAVGPDYERAANHHGRNLLVQSR